MDTDKLSSRESEVLELTAWGASQKEVAHFLKISQNTVDNHIRRIKQKLRLNKVNELSAYWFCTHFNISFDLSPIRRQVYASVLLLFFVTSIFTDCDTIYRGRRLRHRGHRIEESIID